MHRARTSPSRPGKIGTLLLLLFTLALIAPASVPATVVSTHTSTDGHILVTVSVPSAVAPQLTAMVATARIGLVLDSAAR